LIKLASVNRTLGYVQLTFQYDSDAGVQTKVLDANEIVETIRSAKKLLGRNPTQAELRDIINSLFKEMRKGVDVVEAVNWESLIGVDLEA
jgi:hypothetical protein